MTRNRLSILVLATMLVLGIRVEQTSAQCNPTACPGFKTQTQGGWSQAPSGNNPGKYLNNNFATAFPDGLTVGGGCTGAKTLKLTSPAAVRAFLPQGGTPTALTQNLLNPTKQSYDNVLAGQLVTLAINLGFDNTFANFAPSAINLKDLVITTGVFKGFTVQQVFDLGNQKLGGCNVPYTFSQLNDAISSINESYVDGVSSGNFLACPFTVTGVVGNVTCPGGTNGTVTLTVSGGTGTNHTYVWSNGATTKNLSGLAAGNYCVTVTNCLNATQVKCFNVTQPAPVQVTVTPTQPLCSYSTGSAIASASGGGANGFTFLWSNGATGAHATNLAAGTYTVTATNANGCTGSGSVTITVPMALMVTPNVTNVTCPDGSNGSIALAISGGTAPYATSWSSGNNGMNLSAGTYSFTVTDANGCTANGSAAVTQPEPIVVTTTATSQPQCSYGTGSASVSATGGTAPYTYAWSNSTTGASATGLAPDSYTVTVTDANGCTAAGSVTITAPAALSATPAVTNVTCPGGNDGSIALAISGGTAPYTTAWTSGNGMNLSAGSYAFTVTDANGCSVTGSSNVTDPSPISVTATVTSDSNCNDVPCDGAIAASPTGGTAPYTFMWSNNTSGANATGLCPGAYTVTVTDANGCTAGSMAFVVDCIMPPPVDCPPLRTQTQGGYGSEPSGNNVGTYVHENFAAAFPGGVTIGCPGGNTLTLTTAQAVTEFIPSGSTPSVLNASYVDPGQSYQNVLAGQLLATTLSVGFDRHDANFADSDDNLGNRIIATGTFAGLTVNEFLVIANDVLGGCSSAYTPSQVNQTLSAINENYVDGTTDNGFLLCNPCDLNVSITPVINQVCVQDGNVSLTAHATGENAVNVTYAWSNGASTQSITVTPQVGLNAYSVTVTGDNECSAMTSTSFMGNATPSVAVTSQSDATCAGDCNGSAMVNTDDANTIMWSNGANTASVTNLCAGTYGVTVTTPAGCTAAASVTIAQPNPIAVIAAPTSDSNCDDNVCDGSITLTVTGGTAPYTYLWNTNPAQSGATATNLCAGNYNAIVTDANGCSTEAMDILVDCIPVSCEPLMTLTQGGWGALPHGGNPGTYLYANFVGAFPNGLTIGCTAGNTLTLTTKEAVSEFLPSGSTARPLESSLVDPGQTYQNVLAGQLVAATLNVTFDYYDAGFASSDGNLGDRVFVDGPFAGLTVNQVLQIANDVLGGCSMAYTPSQVNEALDQINNNYHDGSNDLGFLTCGGSSSARRAEIRSAVSVEKESIAVYPNPNKGTFTVSIMAHEDARVNVSLVDLTGRTIMTNTYDVKQGTNQLALNVNLASGAYQLVYNNNGSISNQAVIIH